MFNFIIFIFIYLLHTSFIDNILHLKIIILIHKYRHVNPKIIKQLFNYKKLNTMEKSYEIQCDNGHNLKFASANPDIMIVTACDVCE